MAYVPVMMLSVGVFLVIHYLMEVHAGSATSMYDAELGLSVAETPPRRSSHRRFLGRVAPVQLTAIGVPLLGADLRAGAMLLVAALLLVVLFRE